MILHRIRSIVDFARSLVPRRTSIHPPNGVGVWSVLLCVAMIRIGGAETPNEASSDAPTSPPNVILIMTDDQGYGDLSCHGNPVLQTPHLDQLYADSLRLTNYHVDPTCSPTRAALMTGRYSTRTGVWHTIAGRSLMSRDELTLAEIFRHSGYRTAMFGKWHLGDAFPLRPQDQGFDEVVCHGGGGVGQTPDAWGNDYFDDRYWRQGDLERFSGYCTDVWFDEAMKFIDRQTSDTPYFVYLATNAPHGPYEVSEAYRRPYDEVGNPTDRFFGMIANIDDNVGRLMAFLRDRDQLTNTLVIFTTDNGTAAGARVHSAGMRGNKGSEYDGGHRVPCFWHWPAGGLTGGRDIDQLTAHIDIRPTLVELCQLTEPAGPAPDGHSLAPLLLNARTPEGLADRVLFVHSQRVLHPIKWRKSAVMTDRWRLINGKELYDLQQDPDQSDDISSSHPEVVATLRDAYEIWWDSLQDACQQTVRYVVGDPRAEVIELTAHDWLKENVPWHQSMIKRGPYQTGAWAIEVAEAGEYEIALSRWPFTEDQPSGATRAGVSIQGHETQQPVEPNQHHVVFRVSLEPGKTQLSGTFEEADGKQRGAYYARIRRLSPPVSAR